MTVKRFNDFRGTVSTGRDCWQSELGGVGKHKQMPKSCESRGFARGEKKIEERRRTTAKETAEKDTERWRKKWRQERNKDIGRKGRPKKKGASAERSAHRTKIGKGTGGAQHDDSMQVYLDGV